jgi:hypothetical protein
MSASLRTRGHAAVILGAVVTALLSQPVIGASLFFVTHFHAPKLSAQLQDADAAFVLGKEGIRRTASERTDYAMGERHYIRTVRSGYLSANWTYEVTFHSPTNATDDLLFIGFGEAVPDPLFYDEPRNSVNFRISQGMTGFGVGWRVDVVAHDVGLFSSTYWNEGVGSLGGPTGGTYTARIRKVGQRVTFEILGTEIAVEIADLTAAAPFLQGVRTRIFFGAANSAYSFSDMRVLPEREDRMCR